MTGKKTIGLVICLLILVFNIFGIYTNVFNKVNCKIEEKEVWITTEVIKIVDDGGLEYGHHERFIVRYDDHNGETGVLDTNESGNNLKIGDSVTVYRNAKNSATSDSTHGWKLSTKQVYGYDSFTIILFVILTIINIIVLWRMFRKNKT